MGTSICGCFYGVRLCDHPHACGDKAAVKLFKLVRDVSSPRVWGQGLSALGFRLFLGIIPTRVGTSYTTGFLICQGGGSSPRVWGQAEFRLRAFCSSRIIPTRVGTSDEELMNELKKRDHPHAYGDKGTRRLNRSQSPGSSPRVWGQVAVFVYTQKYKGIIPTRVGTSHCIR